jgi:hypothetical protein
MEGQLLVNQDKISHILPELRETGKSSWNFFHTISWINSFCHDGEAIPGKSQHGGDQPHTFFTWPHVSKILSTSSIENCPPF